MGKEGKKKVWQSTKNLKMELLKVPQPQKKRCLLEIHSITSAITISYQFFKKKKTPGSLFLFLAHAGANAFHTTFQLHLPVFQIAGEKRRKKKERKGR